MCVYQLPFGYSGTFTVAAGGAVKTLAIQDAAGIHSRARRLHFRVTADAAYDPASKVHFKEFSAPGTPAVAVATTDFFVRPEESWFSIEGKTLSVIQFKNTDLAVDAVVWVKIESDMDISGSAAS